MFKKIVFVSFLVLTQFAFAQSEDANPVDTGSDSPKQGPEAEPQTELQPVIFSPFSFMLFPGLQLQLNTDNIVLGNPQTNNANIQLGLITQVDRLAGIQLGVINIVKNDLHGIQIGLISNSTKGQSGGIQVSPLLNWADNMGGMQSAYLFNVADEIAGIQLAAMNMAGKVNGIQFGLINVADEASGISLGLVNFIRDGVFQFGIHQLSNKSSEVTFKTGNKWLYTKYSVEKPYDREIIFPAIGGGIRFSFNKLLYVEQDIMARFYTQDQVTPEYQTTVGLFPDFPINIEGAVKFRQPSGSLKYTPIYSVGAAFDFAKLISIFSK